ncbi:MAG: hypothetical protein U9P61_00315 [Patescibacteria group bacterium]|nr:hypothetical protein [Patescibacteria group bacterium]
MPQISIIKKSDIQEARRFDAEFFKPEYLEIERKLENTNHDYLYNLADDNLLYKKGDKQAYCPECFEKTNQLKRMKKVESYEGKYLHIYYKCFVCDYKEEYTIFS